MTVLSAKFSMEKVTIETSCFQQVKLIKFRTYYGFQQKIELILLRVNRPDQKSALSNLDVLNPNEAGSGQKHQHLSNEVWLCWERYPIYYLLEVKFHTTKVKYSIELCIGCETIVIIRDGYS